MIRVFLPATSNEARLHRQDRRAHQQGGASSASCARRRTPSKTYEVRRVLKAFIDGQWLADFDARLAEYARLLTGGTISGGDDE